MRGREVREHTQQRLHYVVFIIYQVFDPAPDRHFVSDGLDRLIAEGDVKGFRFIAVLADELFEELFPAIAFAFTPDRVHSR